MALRGRFHFEGHENELNTIMKICDTRRDLQFPLRSEIVTTLWPNTPGTENDPLHHIVLQAILVRKFDWYHVLDGMRDSVLSNRQATIYHFGLEPCMPPTLMRKMKAQLIHVSTFLQEPPSVEMNQQHHEAKTDTIAVVGMACKVAGADDLDEFWSLLREGKSQHVEVPEERIRFGTNWRELDKTRKWYGNFIRDPDAFDHRFFKKSPREMMSTDPQQRWMLQIAYQAVSQSGYLNTEDPKRHIGCYIGVGCIDYEQNIASHPANAFSATGNLKSFVAGKISHWFGWTGPSLTIDTACSASAVAIHQACRAILTGDCDAALAGGVTVMTSPLWFQNLAGGGFLSPTGNCKPFDADADGYCRGEGIGAVFLKKLSTALDDGDQIIGVIPATAVFQNQNCTPITVPNVESLSDLFRHVTSKSGLHPGQISVVEAHGTGTPVGDPAEYESIRSVFGGPRSDSLTVGSVKGLVGHTETASGIISLIKVLLMINEAAIPPQASFKTLSASIKTFPDDNMDISKVLKPWEARFRAALINNYGASGSNASIIVTQPPRVISNVQNMQMQKQQLVFPIRLCAYDDQSLRAYASRLRRFIRASISSGREYSLADLAFNLSRQSNNTLKQALILSNDNVKSLEEDLEAFETGDPRFGSITIRPTPPVILCFGGQVSTFIGLDQNVYLNCTILRRYLDECDSVIRSMGATGIYPGIFSREPTEDIILLQVMLFATQYSCAKVWIECGVKPVAVLGHSFGELTALCVSGVVDLRDALRMIIGRATAIQTNWGSDKGAMMAVEGDCDLVIQLIRESNKLSDKKAGIACYNGPRSFTLAGPSLSIENVAETIANGGTFSSIRSKRLNVTHAFHSVLVDDLKEALQLVGKEISFNDPVIPIELATEFQSSHRILTSNYVEEHMRNPVYFSYAVQRLAQRYPSAIWLEAGSNSTITNIACRALATSSSSQFQPVNITSNNSMNLLAECTLKLWKQGLPVTFWPYHKSQTSDYQLLLLPPYQFAKARHWVELKEQDEKPKDGEQSDSFKNEAPLGLWCFVQYRDSAKTKARFRINTTTTEFENYVKGHTIAHAAPLCPSTLQVDIVVDSLMSILPEHASGKYQPQIHDLENHAPMCLDRTRTVWLDVGRTNASDYLWIFQIVSEPLKGNSQVTSHVSGKVLFLSADDAQLHREFSRYERLSSYQICQELLEDTNVPDVIQGRNIYRTFSEIVDYGEPYRNVQRIVGKGQQSAGRILKEYTGERWMDTYLADCFCQIAGIFVNCMTDTPNTDMYISTKIEQWIRSPKLLSGDSFPKVWDVLALHHRQSEKEYVSDVFVFDPRNGSLMEVILGIGYQKVPKTVLGQILSRLTTVQSKEPVLSTIPVTIHPSAHTAEVEPVHGEAKINGDGAVVDESNQPDISSRVRDLLCNISGLEPHEIKKNTGLPDIGIDSLVGMELAREIETIFKCSLSPSALLEVTNFQSLIEVIEHARGIKKDITGSGDRGNAVNGHNRTEPSNGITGAHELDRVSSSDVAQNGILTPPEELKTPQRLILDTFERIKKQTDDFIADNKFGDYSNKVLPKQTELCVAHVLEAFNKLGGCLDETNPGQVISRIAHIPKHQKFVDYLYEKLLRDEARLVEIQDGRIIRTTNRVSTASSHDILQELIEKYPDHTNDHRLIYLVGSKLADCLSGETDGVQLIFGSTEGRELVSGLYGQSPINMAFLKQMESFIQMLIQNLRTDQGPLRIFEVGAGTGGTTAVMVKMLAMLDMPVEYTFTDLSPSLVAAARKRFKEHKFVRFRTHDIEKPPVAELLRSQHIVIANNCIHATRSLYDSTLNLREILRPDGFLMVLEMTDTLLWVDLVFGLLEGWWLFEDSREHVVAHQTFWRKEMLRAGYTLVNWTEGHRPEADLQRIMIALLSESRYEQIPIRPGQALVTDLATRQEIVDGYIRTYSKGLDSPILTDATIPDDISVLITGATGSLGSHLTGFLAQLPNVKTVICLNRHNSIQPAYMRQQQAMESRGIIVDNISWSKIRVIETDTAKPHLGLSDDDYNEIVQSVTHIIHNSWPMSVNRSVKGFEPQFRAMRNLIQVAREASIRKSRRISFQFISSIATVGLYPVWSGQSLVPEERTSIESVLPSGYSDAKFVCERMLDETLHLDGKCFRAMAVRIGQISGSKTSGYWNPIEHLAFLLKSSQTIQALPQFEGVSDLLTV
ncbi:Type I Iterative PKS [Paecilomyces lecythidis]